VRVAEGVQVATSRYWQTNSGLITTTSGSVLVDAGVFPHEMRSLAQTAKGRIVAGISTHEHWDHLLWSEALGAGIPRYASPRTCRAMDTDRDGLLQRLEQEEARWGVSWDRALFGRVEAQPAGELAALAPPIRLIDLAGHAAGQIGVWVEGVDVLFAADTASDIDPPALADDLEGVTVYISTLERMLGTVGDASVVVPGHGAPCGPAEARRRLLEDRRYLDVVLEEAWPHDASADVVTTSRRIAAMLDDRRLSSSGGWELHLENVATILDAREAASD
jgi:glyoxylase-like metal-dependent hydrolase (beta-lactamase superfamily II)